MGQGDRVPRRSIGGALVLIALGLLFLFFNLRPGSNPWPVISNYWPLILIFVGLGKMWDYAWRRQHPDATGGPWISGTSVALVVLLVLFGVAAFHGHFRHAIHHDVKTLDRQGAQSVRADIAMPAGELRLAGGSSNLLDADFRYNEAEGTPRIEYRVSNGVGDLTIRQDDKSIHMGMGRTANEWDLKLSNDVPLDLTLNMGAGEGILHLRDVPVTNLSVNMGAGELQLDLTGDRKKDLTADIHGGVGQATIRLPRDVGVRVQAHGGIGSIETRGLRHDGDEYVNDAYGKSQVTIKLTVEGGIGQIVLDLER